MRVICRLQQTRDRQQTRRHGWAKLKDLRRYARWVLEIVFRPSDYLVMIVGSCSKAVISTREIWKPPHFTLFPNEPEIDKADRKGPRVEGRATPELAPWLRICCLGNTYDDALGILHVPCDAAVGSTECAEVEQRTVSPQNSMPRLVAR